MQIRFHGAVRTVTGSMHEVSANGESVLLDCGLFQGRRKEARARNANLTVDAGAIRSVVLSHAHIDHSGNLPSLVKGGFTGSIFSTRATHSLCRVMLKDAAYIQEKDAEFINRKVEKRGGERVEPLYVAADAEAAIERFFSVPYHYTTEVAHGIRTCFYDAGHILGSALVVLDVELPAGGRKRIGFTGDLGRRFHPILRDPERIPPVDYLITESTYGNRLHEGVPDMKERLAEKLKETAREGGRVIIPAFSVGRTQNIVYFLHQLFDEGRLPRIPIFVDSPLAVNATEVYRSHPECYDEETQEFLESEQDPFGFSLLRYVRSVEESKALNLREGPFVVISASGMCEAGRVLHHLKHAVGSPRNLVLIVGFQAAHTLGRRLVERERDVKIFGSRYRLRARVEKMNGFSAHADREELSAYVKNVPVKHAIFVVHGEEDASLAFAEHLRSLKRNVRVHVPTPGEVVDL